MKKVILLSAVCLVLLSMGNGAFAQSAPQIQTNSATNIQNNSATLNANLQNLGANSAVTLWFQWGSTTAYGNQTTQIDQSNTGAFSQTISGLASNTTFHFRVAAQNRYGITYGLDMTFTTNASGNYSGSATLAVAKKVVNLSTGNANWQTFVSAKPGDVLSFAITMQANGNQDIHNVFVRDILPSGLIYKGNLLLNASLNNSQNSASGISVVTIPANGIYIISYQAQVAQASNFAYGTTTQTNSATITSNETGSQTVSASVIINNSYVAGATYVPTGITNNPIKDSFFLPIMLIILGSWLYFSGKIYTFADWIKTKI